MRLTNRWGVKAGMLEGYVGKIVDIFNNGLKENVAKSMIPLWSGLIKFFENFPVYVLAKYPVKNYRILSNNLLNAVRSATFGAGFLTYPSLLRLLSTLPSLVRFSLPSLLSPSSFLLLLPLPLFFLLRVSFSYPPPPPSLLSPLCFVSLLFFYNHLAFPRFPFVLFPL